MTAKAKVFMSGNSQAVRLPKPFRLRGKEVNIRRDKKTGDIVLSEQREESWASFLKRIRKRVPPDFMADRHDPPAERRPWMYE